MTVPRPDSRPSLENALGSYDRALDKEFFSAGERERSEVTVRFPLDQWPTMPLERYALGQEESEDTFCRWMEFRSQHLGSMRGGSARKLLIYKRKDKPGWYFDPESKDEQEAWQNVRGAFVQAFQKAKLDDWNAIDDLAPLAGGPALRLKTLHVYFPDEIIPIYSQQHLRHFLQLLDRPEGEDRSIGHVEDPCRREGRRTGILVETGAPGIPPHRAGRLGQLLREGDPAAEAVGGSNRGARARRALQDHRR
jgi:hypothetical protein